MSPQRVNDPISARCAGCLCQYDKQTLLIREIGVFFLGFVATLNMQPPLFVIFPLETNIRARPKPGDIGSVVALRVHHSIGDGMSLVAVGRSILEAATGGEVGLGSSGIGAASSSGIKAAGRGLSNFSIGKARVFLKYFSFFDDFLFLACASSYWPDLDCCSWLLRSGTLVSLSPRWSGRCVRSIGGAGGGFWPAFLCTGRR